MNTLKSGVYRWMIFKEGATWVGVALEFNIVVTGNDPRVVEFELQEAVAGYLESAKKITGFRDHQIDSLLNQRADEEYESRWKQATQTVNQESVPSPFSNLYKAGVANLATA